MQFSHIEPGKNLNYLPALGEADKANINGVFMNLIKIKFYISRITNSDYIDVGENNSITEGLGAKPAQIFVETLRAKTEQNLRPYLQWCLALKRLNKNLRCFGSEQNYVLSFPRGRHLLQHI